MPKVLLVEDDNNLREIFQMRLQAEGYTTAVASDGEEGLVVAMKEKPDLIIADIMMPKLSGFDMVENLKAAPETKNIKVIMMTALGQAEDRARGEKLGVVKYLVKSQVTLEDFARVVKEVLGGASPPGENTTQEVVNSSSNVKESEKSMDENANPSTNPTPAPDSMPSAPAGGTPPMGDTGQQSAADEQGAVNDQVKDFASSGDSGSMSAPSMPGDGGMGSTGGGTPPAAQPPMEPPASPDTPASGGDSGSMPSAPAGGTA